MSTRLLFHVIRCGITSKEMSSSGDHAYLDQVTWHSIQKLLRHFKNKQKSQPCRGIKFRITTVSGIHPQGTLNIYTKFLGKKQFLWDFLAWSKGWSDSQSDIAINAAIMMKKRHLRTAGEKTNSPMVWKDHKLKHSLRYVATLRL